MAATFDDWRLRPELASKIRSLNWVNCTPIQESAIPLVLQGKDVAGLAQTGTGKTGAFLTPILERILWSLNPEVVDAGDTNNPAHRAFINWQKNNFVLVLVPTRELAEQVAEQGLKLGADLGIRVEAIYGGVAYEKQKQALREGVHIIVATPGRLIDLYKEHLVDLRQVRAVIFDEADRMFDMGFKDDMKFLLSRIPRDRQFLVFSATLNFDVLNVAYQFGAHPIECNISRDQAKAENVKDEIFHLGQDDKPKYLLSVLKKHNPRQAIVFSNFKSNVARIAKFLSDNGVPAVGISSLLTQAQRNRVMEQFKTENNSINILVATDVAARGLDIQGVDMVINFELPDDPENYVHRIGRTGRAGAAGLAFSFVCDRDVDALSRMEDYLQHKITIGWLDDADLVSDHKPFPEISFDEGKPYSPRAQGQGGPGGGGRRPERGGPGGRRGGRGGDRDRRGPRREGGHDQRGDRPHRSAGPQGEQRAHGASANGQRPAGQPPREGGTHRDRRNGRHGEQRRDFKQGSGGQGQHAHRDNGGRNGQRPRHPNRANRPFTPGRGQQGKRVTPPPTTLGTKVTQFFKRLFGA